MVERFVRDEEAAGSNPASPTTLDLRTTECALKTCPAFDCVARSATIFNAGGARRRKEGDAALIPPRGSSLCDYAELTLPKFPPLPPARPLFKEVMCYVYVLRSEKTGKRYVGVTENLERRLAEHNTPGKPDLHAVARLGG